MSGNCHPVDKSSRGRILDATVEGHKVGMMLAINLLRARSRRDIPLGFSLDSILCEGLHEATELFGFDQY